MAASALERMDDLKLMAGSDTLTKVLDTIEKHLRKSGWPEESITEILIAAEEIYVNIVHYAYSGDVGEAEVQIDMGYNPRRVKMTFVDQGIPYNPLENADPDITLSADERNVGGLGIYMAKCLMDHLEYHYENGCNMLTMEKSLDS